MVGLILDELTQRKRVLWEAGLGGAFIAIASLMTSLYSMQVYDRVIPSHSLSTLLTLTLGALHSVRTNFPVDARRVYLTGLSLGAMGMFDYLPLRPDLFAAAVPMSGSVLTLPLRQDSTYTMFRRSRIASGVWDGSRCSRKKIGRAHV